MAAARLRFVLLAVPRRPALSSMFVRSYSSKKEGGKTWSAHQADREEQMKGLRFLGADLTTQPLPQAAIDFIANTKIIEIHGREAVCDGGGGPLGHPRIYVNVDHGTGVCGYCGLRFRQSHGHEELDATAKEHTVGHHH